MILNALRVALRIDSGIIILICMGLLHKPNKKARVI